MLTRIHDKHEQLLYQEGCARSAGEDLMDWMKTFWPTLGHLVILPFSLGRLANTIFVDMATAYCLITMVAA